MNWFLILITAGFTHLGTGTIDRAFRPLDGPFADRTQCEEILKQQRGKHEGTLACMPSPKDAVPTLWKSDRAA